MNRDIGSIIAGRIMHKANFEENELRQKINKIRNEISNEEKKLEPGSGSGFGDPDAKEQQHDLIKFKKEEEARLCRDLNDLIMRKTKNSSSRSSWLSAIAAVISAITGILVLFHIKI